ncbi:MAG: hypothetical protein HKN49_14865, partial [Gammaproteobacteria bacterium]|nr:hypothetical protein [Gammaproteobacteria bacterium]
MLGALLPLQFATAAKWDIEPSLFVAGTYTDNLELLGEPDASVPLSQRRYPSDEFITEASVGFGLTGTGPRFDASFNYRLQGLFYSDFDDETLSFANTSGKIRVLGESLFVDFSGRINQQIVNPGGRVG